jgi:hypothetical protein
MLKTDFVLRYFFYEPCQGPLLQFCPIALTDIEKGRDVTSRLQCICPRLVLEEPTAFRLLGYLGAAFVCCRQNVSIGWIRRSFSIKCESQEHISDFEVSFSVEITIQTYGVKWTTPAKGKYGSVDFDPICLRPLI